MKKLIALILFCLIFSLCSCSETENDTTLNKDNIIETTTTKEQDVTLNKGDVVEMATTKDGVDEFYIDLQKTVSNKDLRNYAVVSVENVKFDKSEIYNITPENSKETTGHSLFYDFKTGWLFLYDGNKVLDWEVSLDHIHKPAFADVNNDGYYEYIACVVNNGDTNRQVLSVHDLKTKNVYNIATALTYNHVICATSSQGRCYVYYDSAYVDESIGNKFTVEVLVGEVRYTPGKGFYYEEKAEK